MGSFLVFVFAFLFIVVVPPTSESNPMDAYPDIVNVITLEYPGTREAAMSGSPRKNGDRRFFCFLGGVCTQEVPGPASDPRGRNRPEAKSSIPGYLIHTYDNDISFEICEAFVEKQLSRGTGYPGHGVCRIGVVLL